MSTNSTNDYISLKEIILKLIQIFKEIISKWWLIGLFCIIFTSIFLWSHYKSIPNYNAELKFLIEGDNSNSIGSLGGVLGQLGIRKNSKNNPYKVIEIARSKKLTEDILNYKFKNTIIVEDIIEKYGLKEKWKTNSNQLDIIDFSTTPLDLKIEQHRKIFNSLYIKIWGTNKSRKEALVKINYNDESGIYSIKSTTVDENLSIELSNQSYQLIKSFFEEEVYATRINTINALKTKVDSLNNLINKKVYELASFQDRNYNSFSQTSNAQANILKTEIQSLNITYAEILKNYELADLSMKDSKPLFMLLDKPLSPINPTKSSLIISIIKGIAIGLFIGILYIISIMFYKEIMQN